MTKLEQAARQALEALEVWSDASASLKGQEAITALREALAEQAEQEPDAIDGLARACNLAGVDYQTFLRIKAYLPVTAPVRTKDFAALVAANEREACAKVCAEGWKEGIGAKHQGDVFAVAIRARGEK